MGNFRVPWTRQPSYAASLSDIAREAKTFVLPMGGRVSPVSLAGPAWTVSGTPKSSYGPPGNAIETTGTSQYWDTSVADGAFTTAFTAIFVLQKTDTTNRESSLFGVTSWTDYILNAHVPWSDGTTYFDFGGNSGERRVSVAGLDYSKPTCLIFSAGPRGLEIWQDGILRASNTTAASRTSISKNVTIQNGVVTLSDLQKIYLCALWDKQFSQQQNFAFTKNPWQLFAPISRTFLMGADAGGGSGLTVTGTVGAGVAEGSQASISLGTTISAGIGAAAAAGLAAAISLGTTVGAGIGAATAEGLQAGVSLGTTISAGTGAGTASGLTADILTSGLTVSAGIGEATAEGAKAGISLGLTLSAGIGAASADGISSTIVVPTTTSDSVGGYWPEVWRPRKRRKVEPESIPRVAPTREAMAAVAAVAAKAPRKRITAADLKPAQASVADQLDQAAARRRRQLQEEDELLLLMLD